MTNNAKWAKDNVYQCLEYKDISAYGRKSYYEGSIYLEVEDDNPFLRNLKKQERFYSGPFLLLVERAASEENGKFKITFRLVVDNV